MKSIILAIITLFFLANFALSQHRFGYPEDYNFCKSGGTAPDITAEECNIALMCSRKTSECILTNFPQLSEDFKKTASKDAMSAYRLIDQSTAFCIKKVSLIKECSVCSKGFLTCLEGAFGECGEFTHPSTREGWVHCFQNKHDEEKLQHKDDDNRRLMRSTE